MTANIMQLDDFRQENHIAVTKMQRVVQLGAEIAEYDKALDLIGQNRKILQSQADELLVNARNLEDAKDRALADLRRLMEER